MYDMTPYRLIHALIVFLIILVVISFVSTGHSAMTATHEMSVVDANGDTVITRIYDLSWNTTVLDWGLAADDWGLEDTCSAADMSEEGRHASNQLRNNMRMQKDMQLLSDISEGVQVRVLGDGGKMMLVEGDLAGVERFEKLLEIYHQMHANRVLGVAVRGYLIDADAEGIDGLIRMKHHAVDTADSTELKRRLEEMTGGVSVRMMGQVIENGGSSWVSRVGQKPAIKADNKQTKTKAINTMGHARAKLKVFEINDAGLARVGLTLGLHGQGTEAAEYREVEMDAPLDPDLDEEAYRRQHFLGLATSSKKETRLEKVDGDGGMNIFGGRYRSVSELQLPGSLVVVQSVWWDLSEEEQKQENKASDQPDQNTDGEKMMIWIVDLGAN